MTHTHHLAALALLASLTVALGACAAAPDARTTPRYTLQSEPVTPLGGGCAAMDARRWAVVIGVNSYLDPGIPPLGGSVNDAWSLYHYLASPHGGAIPPNRLRLLLNEEATRKNVDDALGNFLGQACPQDQVVVFFAGHGAPEPGREDDAFLLLHDTEIANMVGTAVSMKQLPGFLAWRAGQTGRLLLLVDACHSGAITFPGDKARGVKDPKRAELVVTGLQEVAKAQPGWGVISAASSDQYAYEAKAGCEVGGALYQGGLFTCRLLEALAGAADTDASGNITLHELYTHLRDKVSADSFEQQLPQISGSLDGEVVVAEVPAGDGAASIPQVPERFLIERSDTLAPYLTGGAILTGATLLGAAGLNLWISLSASAANGDDPALQTRDEVLAERDTHDALVDTMWGIYAGGAVLGLTTLGLWLFDLTNELQGIDEVYQLPPWFELRVAPTNGGAAIGLEVQLP